MPYKIRRLSYDGAIDADGHILEPATLWEDYLEERYKPRALRIKVDDAGLEYLEVDGRKSDYTKDGSLVLSAGMGEEDRRPGPDRRYMDNIPFGGADAKERVDLLDQENLDAAVLYPTLELVWEVEVTDLEITVAYQRAYNRWIADFCRDSGGRLVPTAHLSLLDPEAAAIELERAVRDGCKGAFLATFTHTRKPHGHPDHDPIYAKAVELDVPIALHPTLIPGPGVEKLIDWTPSAAGIAGALYQRSWIQLPFVSYLTYGTLDRFPSLRLGLLESGSGWIGSVLDRLDSIGELPHRRGKRALKPSEYFRRNFFISGDPDELATSHIIDYVGADCFVWATDYPHFDHPDTWVPDLERNVERLSPNTRSRFLGDNIRRIYKLD